MDYLPKDPAILVSSVNMLLRDEEFDTLESLCYNFGTEPKDIKNYLFGHGFVFSDKQKQFRPIGYDSVTNDNTERPRQTGAAASARGLLRDHKRFQEDITKAVLSLESVLEGRAKILENML